MNTIILFSILITIAIGYILRPKLWLAVLLALGSFSVLAFIVFQTGPLVRVVVSSSSDKSESFRDGVLALHHHVDSLQNLILLHGIILSIVFIAREWRIRK